MPEVRSVDSHEWSLNAADLSTWPASVSRPIVPFKITLPGKPDATLDGPVTPHLLRLRPGDLASITRFIDLLGVYPLLQWMFDERREDAKRWSAQPESDDWQAETIDREWIELLRDERVARKRLIDDWTSPETSKPVIEHLGRLHGAWNIQTGDSDFGGGVRAFVHRHRAEFETRLDVVQGRVVQSPLTIISRSYLELLDLLERGLKPSRCDYCEMLFPPRRARQRYCPGTSCGTDGYFAQYEKTPYRREYQRQYKRFKRGTITQDDWDRWRDAHPGPEEWNEGDDD